MPGDRCVINSCKSVGGPGSGLSFHRFPSNKDEDSRALAWFYHFVEDAGTTLDHMKKNPRLCSLHFDRAMIEKRPVPTKFEPGESLMNF